MNLKNWSNNRRLKIIECDVNDFLNFEVDKIWNESLGLILKFIPFLLG